MQGQRALEKGKYEAIATSGQSVADELVHLCLELGVFEELECLEVRREREGIADELLLRTLAVLPFIEPDSLEELRRRCVAELFQRKLVKGRVCAIDGSGLRSRYRVVGLLSVHKEQSLWLSWRVLAGSEYEKGQEASVVRSMVVEEVLMVGGSEAMEWLLMDALYADGPLLAWLEHSRGIHALVRLPEDRLLYKDARALADHDMTEWHTHTDVRYVKGRKQARQVSVTMADELTSWDSFVAAAKEHGCLCPSLTAILIHSQDKANPSDAEDWALVSTRPWRSAWSGYSLWRDRWLIENSGFRELKEAWHLEQVP